jgi:Protease inhibitor Inh
MTKSRPAAIICASLAALVLVSGCNRSVSALDVPPASLPPAPLDPVQSGTLDPVTGQPMQPAPGQIPGEQLSGDTQVAGLDPNDGTQPEQFTPPPQVSSEAISREAMAGTWTVASDNPECRIILAFTKWSGGYRAATRRCNAPELSGVTAWDVRENQVVLVDGTGNSVATLYSSGPERYEGRTNTGQPITFTR